MSTGAMGEGSAHVTFADILGNKVQRFVGVDDGEGHVLVFGLRFAHARPKKLWVSPLTMYRTHTHTHTNPNTNTQCLNRDVPSCSF
jgi:hypothetical protein